MPRGGKREGAGRKPVQDKRIILSARVNAETIAVLDGLAEREGKGRGEMLDMIIMDYCRR